eukprot:5258903-Amphidinium_carterae.5
MLQSKAMPRQHRALDAVKDGTFETCTLGASMQRGPKISKVTRSGEWKEILKMVHELARRRPDSLQRP